MNADAPGSDGTASDLEGALGRGLGPRERLLRHSSLRLQPTVLAPPPGQARRPADEPLGAGVSAEDDIDLGLDDDRAARRRQLLLAAAGVAIALLGLGAWLLLGRPGDAPTAALPPPVQAPPPAVPAPAAPVPPPAQEAAPAAPPQQQAAVPQDPAMGELSTELVPPSTEGLSPARKVNAIRIIMDGDREVRP